MHFVRCFLRCVVIGRSLRRVRAVSSMIFTLVWPVIPLVLQVLVLAYFVASMAYLASTGRAEFYRNDTGLLSAIPCDPAVSATFHYTDSTRPDPTRQTPRTCRRPAPTQRTLSETRVGSGRVRSVEFGLKSTNCYRTDSHQRPHRCCHPSNSVEFIDRFLRSSRGTLPW